MNLGDIQALMMPMTTAYGHQKATMTQAGARLSLQLARAAYTMQVDDWRDAGWQDVSFQIDHTLLTGTDANHNGGLSGFISEYRQFVGRVRAKSKNIINQVLGTVHNLEESDTCKAIVMIRPDGTGKYLVAIGFMGTGRRVQDWLANIRIDNDQGMHQGCLQLTKRFEENLPDIVFDDTAAALGLEKLTLQEIIQECKKTDSRFKIWLAGHSQGGAVMQLFAYRLLLQGVLRKNLIGYSFASPSVLYGSGVMNLQSVPLFHLINTDDPVPRLGAQLHIGQCYLFSPAEEERRKCYGTLWGQESYRQAFSLLQKVRNTEDLLILMMALCRALQDLSDEATVLAASELMGRFLPDKVVSRLGGKMEVGLKALERYLERSYGRMTGTDDMPESLIHLSQKYITGQMDQMGPRAFVKCLLQVMGMPHRLRYKAVHGDAVPVYEYMTGEGYGQLKKAIMPQYPLANERLKTERKRPQGRFGYAGRRNAAQTRRDKQQSS